MAFVLWTSEEDGIDLGNPLDLFIAFAEVGDVASGDEYEELRGVPLAGEDTVSAEYADKVSRQAADALKLGGIGDHGRWILGRLAGTTSDEKAAAYLHHGDTFRTAFTRAWLKRADEREERLVAVVRRFLSEQAAEIVRKLPSIGLNADPTSAAKRAFKAKKWNDRLRREMGVWLADTMAQGAALELNATEKRRAAAGTIEKAEGWEISPEDLLDLSVDIPQQVLDGIVGHTNDILEQDYWDDINETTLDKLTLAIRDGIDAGETRREITARVQEALGEEGNLARARAIARTESTGAMNAGHQEARSYLEDEGVIEGKTWLSTRDARTRETHLEMDGQERENDEMFDLPDGEQALYPGAHTLSAGERINCRCVASASTVFSKGWRLGWLKAERVSDDADSKAFCPTGPGGGIDPTCSPGTGSQAGGTQGFSAGIDTSKWSPTHSSAKAAKNKIGAMEALAGTGDVEKLLAAKPSFGNNPNSYQKAVIKAHETLVAQVQASALVNSPMADAAEEAEGVLNISSWTKSGPQLGSNKGGQYLAEDGTKYYVKFPKDEARARNEVLASKLYQAAGSNAAELSLVETSGNIGVASKWIDDSKEAELGDAASRELAQQSFATHAWLANWDAVGDVSQPDNIRIVGEGAAAHAVTMDVGGSLEYRAQGGEKDFGDLTGEWNTLRNSTINSTGAVVFGDMTPQQLVESAAKVSAVDDTTIRALVEKYHPGIASKKTALADTLISRRDDITSRAAALGLPAGVIEAGQSAADSVPPAVPPPPKFGGATTAMYQAKVNTIHELAKAGDIAGIEAIKTTADAKQGYTKKIHAYKAEVLASLGAGGKVSAATEAQSALKAASAVKIDATVLAEPPEFFGTYASANAVIVAEVQKVAATGDLDALKGMAFKSPKLTEWHARVVHDVASQLNQPPPSKSLNSKLSDLAAAARVVKGGTAEKIGHYSVLAKSAGIPAEFEGTGATLTTKDWLDGHQAWQNLPLAEQKAVSNYTEDGYITTNKILRGGNPTGSPGERKIARTEALDTANGVTKASIVLKPGITLTRFHNLGDDDVNKLVGAVGSVVQDAGVISTSTSSDVFSGGKVHWTLTVGEGVRGLPAEGFSEEDGEMEVMLPPNTRYLITSAKRPTTLGYRAIDVTAVILPFQPGQCCPP